MRGGLVCIRMFPYHPREHALHFVARLLQGGGRRQARDQFGHAVAAVLHHQRAQMVRAHHHVQQRVHRVGEERRGLQHSDHGHGRAAEVHRRTDDRGVAAELFQPELVGQHHDRRHALPVIGRCRESAELGGKSHDLEVIAGDQADVDAGCLVVDAHRAEPRRILRDSAERGHSGAEVADFGHRERQVAAGGPVNGLAQVDETVTVAVRQRLEQHAAHDAEDRGVGADAEREGHDHDGCERGRMPQRAHGILDVSRQALQPRQAALVAHGFHGLGHAAGRKKCLTARVLGRHAAADELSRLHLQMRLHFRAQVVIGAVLVEDARNAREQGADLSHDSSGRSARKAAMRSAVLFHSRASRASCLRPAGVSA